MIDLCCVFGGVARLTASREARLGRRVSDCVAASKVRGCVGGCYKFVFVSFCVQGRVINKDRETKQESGDENKSERESGRETKREGERERERRERERERGGETKREKERAIERETTREGVREKERK